MHKGKIVAKKLDLEVIDCEVCKFKHLNPIPSEEDIEEYYKNNYYNGKAPELLNFEKEKKELKWLELWYREELLVLNEYVKSETKRLLDIGCGNGLFLKFMKENGWEVVGVEPSLIASKNAQSMGLNVYATTFEKFIEERWYNYFDVINLRNILEHVAQPIKVLEISKTLLKDSGVIYIRVPNDFNPLQLSVHELGKPKWWIVPDHISYFDFHSLENLLESLDFEVILKTTDFPMEVFLLMGEDYIENEKIGSKCH